MLFTDSAWLLSAALGAGIGIVLSLTGAGGAILSVPALVFGLNMPVAHAAPIGLLAVAVSASIGAALALRAGILRYRAAARMVCGVLVMSPPGLWLAHQIPNAPLTALFAAVLVYVAFNMLRQAARELRSGGAVEINNNPPCKLGGSIGRLIWAVP